MLIISKYKDYYDYYQGIFGIDKTKVYERKIDLKDNIFLDKSDRFYDTNKKEINHITFYICSKSITFFYFNGNIYHSVDEIENMLKISKNILFSTELLPNPIPKPDEWWYYGLDHGQHISFYSQKTFEYLAKKYSLNYINLGGMHLFTTKKISNLQLKILKFSKFGLHKLLQKRLNSKTWEDYLRMSERK